MSRFRLISAAVLLAMAANVHASATVSTTTDSISRALKATSNATSKLSSSLRDNKIVREAQDDAASFVASEGAIRGVRLESAFEYIRQEAPEMKQATDAQLAEAILTI
ncbi:DUF2388 domain-containing protein [Pseudomonas sp. 6D_7.1_Bac1]|uniref:DUF2388 domain-containing protein n=1 Tax=Pseudomonas sp. 6D_7.1_Bac1 TaxID=2971615 RepID=UPI0021C68C2D|nr:DUF2388 domain-containing protein [Pseudomonas sp. 6D_7.1_Bac1]MCU1752705.1 DUF2388 domain-containing protein [Pseudomonas sp. 6D_7.1_Bac1]